MLKLNNHGWGLGTFIVFIVVFIIAIILITIGAIRLGISSKDDVSTLPVTQASPSPTASSNTGSEDNSDNNYIALVNNYQEQLVDVMKDYIKTQQVVIIDQDSLTITVVSLVKDNYINKLEINGNVCTGYVTVTSNGNYDYKSFLNCGEEYVSDSYDGNLDESF